MRTSGSPGFVSRSKMTARASLASTKTPRIEFSVVISAFSSEVETGSRQENARNQESRAPFRFYRNGALGRDAGERQYGMHQRVGAGGAIGLSRILQLVVADAVLAGNEDHRCRHHIGEVAGVMTRARGDAAVAIAERPGGAFDRIDQFGIEYRRRLAPDGVEPNLDLAPRSDLRDGAAITASPVVPTAFGPCAFAIRSTASTISESVASASRRSGIGVVPAW